MLFLPTSQVCSLPEAWRERWAGEGADACCRDERLRWVLGWPAPFSETTRAAAVEAEGAPDVSVQASDAAGQSLG